MADISDVEQAVANLVVTTLYPGGATESSVIGTLCRVYRGWPNTATLNSDLSAGIVNVTIIPDNDSGRTTTRYLPQWTAMPAQPGAGISTAERVITISGTPTAGDVVGALIDGVPFAYRVEAGDSVGLVAANFCQIIQASRPAVSQGFTIEVAGARSIVVRAVCDHTASTESRRQEKDIRIICWCPSPTVRDEVATAIDASVSDSSFILLSDGSSARISYKNTAAYDQAQNALLYRRDLIYVVEYPTISMLLQPSMLFGGSLLNSNATYG